MKDRRLPRLLGACVVVAIVPMVQTRSERQPTADRTVWDSVFSAPQAARGETAYVKSCSRCHQASLAGADQSPPLAGGAFLGNWNGLPLSDLQERIRTTMPPDSAVGIFDRQLVTDVMAYMLKVNGFPAGASDLPKEPERLKEIIVQAAKP
jgi:mono/diheme cytochrome c family protein